MFLNSQRGPDTRQGQLRSDYINDLPDTFSHPQNPSRQTDPSSKSPKKSNQDRYLPDLRPQGRMASEKRYENNRRFAPKSLGKSLENKFHNEEAHSSNLFNEFKDSVIEIQSKLFSPPKLNQQKNFQNTSSSPLRHAILPVKERKNMFIQRIELQNEQLEKAEALVRELTLQNHYLEISNNSLKQKINARDETLYQYKNKSSEYEIQLKKKREQVERLELEIERLRRENSAKSHKEVQFVQKDSNAECYDCKQAKKELEQFMSQLNNERMVLGQEIFELKEQLSEVKEKLREEKANQVFVLQKKLEDSERMANELREEVKINATASLDDNNERVDQSKSWYDYGDSTEELLCGSPHTFEFLRSMRHPESSEPT